MDNNTYPSSDGCIDPPHTYTLLIFEQVPESTELYLVPNTAALQPLFEAMKVADGHFVNSSENDDTQEEALGVLSWGLMTFEHHDEANERAEAAEAGMNPSLVGALAEFKTETPIQPDGVITRIYRAGFLL